MKRKLIKVLSLCVVALISTVIFSACQKKKYEGPFSCISSFKEGKIEALVDMTEEAHTEILDILNAGEWVSNIANCAYDYEFTAKKQTIRYHSECGTFIDIINGCSLEISDSEREKVNDILGVKNLSE